MISEIYLYFCFLQKFELETLKIKIANFISKNSKVFEDFLASEGPHHADKIGRGLTDATVDFPGFKLLVDLRLPVKNASWRGP